MITEPIRTGTSMDGKTCSVCGAKFSTNTEKGIHVTLEHDLRRTGGTDQTRPFIACNCGERTFIGETCEGCGKTVVVPEWSR